MRIARKKMIGSSCYYHCYSRIAGIKGEYLFTEIDKERGMRIVKDLSQLFFIEPISMAWMGNHWHIVLYTPEEFPSMEQTVMRYNNFYYKKKKILDPSLDIEECKKVQKQLVDISFFMRQIHQKFTYYINRTHERHGTLWSERFKSTILEDNDALLNCVKYVELNPVRAGLVDKPANYRFCTWGHYCQTGKHLFGDNFIRHMRRYFCDFTDDLSDEALYSEFRGELARTIAYESGAASHEVTDAIKQARKNESMPVCFLRRSRYWTDGAIIGSKSFIKEVGILFDNKERVLKKQFSSGTTTDGIEIYCFKRLRVNVN